SCWYRDPGRCHIQDGMQSLYPLLRESDILVLATPVYIPLPGDMQNLINRLCPLAEPMLSTDWGRTKARLREGVRLRKAALVATGAWWETENLDILVRIVKELCLKMGLQFTGAVLRPHALMLDRDPPMAEMVYQDVLIAGEQLATTGQMSQKLLDRISAPLVEEGELRELFNEMNRKAAGQDG
ncbi:MAG: hypothetical protein MUE65_05550, partial [Methanomassiliicoccales archaeon]|nr:hypothetical protein [Methanomassiliicoccales archaeon]